LPEVTPTAADGEAAFQVVDAIEINQPLQRFLQGGVS